MARYYEEELILVIKACVRFPRPIGWKSRVDWGMTLIRRTAISEWQIIFTRNMETLPGNGAVRAGTKQCPGCPQPLVRSQNKFCSQLCYWRYKRGRKHSWGENISAALRGKPKSPEHVAKVAEALRGRSRPEITGDRHPAWKGDEVSYGTLHDWVSFHKGRPTQCEHCPQSDPNKRYHWANKSGRYLRDLDDWMRLCVPCHSRYDRNRSKEMVALV